MVREIPLTRGYVALVDDADYEDLNRFSWRLLSGRCGGLYACRDGVPAFINGKRQTVLMHREIAKPPTGLFVDHINGDGLDNRRSNLRVVTHYQNMLNRPQPTNKTGYRGVTRIPNGKYVARIWLNGQSQRLGTFDDPADAGRAYDAAAIKAHGDFAVLNFPSELRAAA